MVFGAPQTRLTTAPSLCISTLIIPLLVETDASDYANAAYLRSKLPVDGDIHPIVFYSRSMQPAELNYEIYGQAAPRQYSRRSDSGAIFGGSDIVVLFHIVRSHRTLEYFGPTNRLTCHQVRWSNTCRVHYLIRYRLDGWAPNQMH